MTVIMRGKNRGRHGPNGLLAPRADSLSDDGVKLRALTARDRLQLLKFVCSFVWADLDVGPSEKTFVLSLTQRLGLSDAEIRQVQAWLETPPPVEEIDPTLVPPQHRRLFLEAIEQALTADGAVTPPESESLALFRQLLTPP